MLRILFLSLALLLVASLRAQERQAYLAIGGGAGAPMGDFRNTNVEKQGAGLAREGAVFGIDLGYLMGKRFGLAATLRGTGNATDVKAISNGYRSLGLDAAVEPGTWITAGLYVGGLGLFPMNERWSFSTRVMVGYASVTLPVLKVNTRDGGLIYRQESAVVGAPAYMLGVGMKGDLGERLCLVANLDLMGMQASFTDVKTDNPISGPLRVSYTQSISLVTASLALGYRF